MHESLKKRLLALEHENLQAQKCSGVVTYGRNETQDQAMARARAQGVTGAVLLAPEVMTYEEWTEMMKSEAGRAKS
jgi:hypothetical protein